MFSAIRPNLIESDTGFSVEVLGPTGLRYTEGERSMKIHSELLNGPSGLLVFSNSVKQWSPPHSAETVDAPTVERIIENIRAAFKFRGFDIDVV